MNRPTLDETYLRMAETLAQRSSCERKKVGALIVKDRRILSEGYNGTAPGANNCCEENGKTKPTVSHAEINAITSLAKHGGPGCDGAVLYCTLSCCLECAKAIVQAGIERVIVREYYRDDRGMQHLAKNGIRVQKLR